jgi:peptide/nickel transport system permease protein
VTPAFLVRRVATFGLVLWLALTANFLLPRLGTPELSRPRGPDAHQLGLDRPIWDQYVAYFSDLLHLDLSYSLSSYPSRVADQIGYALPWTIALLGTTSIIAWLLGTLLGAGLGWRRSQVLSRYVFPPLMMLSAAPYFITAMLLLYVLAFRLRLLPLGGGYDTGAFPEISAAFGLQLVQHAVLPALSIVLASTATWAIGMRGLVVSLDGEDYILLAEAKGLKSSTLFVRYVLRNAMLPQVTALGIALGQIVSGGLLVEAVFRYPGLGGLLLRAILTRDYPLEQGIVLVVVVSIAAATLVLDIVYPVLDPRVRRGVA